MEYIVKSVVCDYGVFEKTDNEEKLIEICNSLSNAELIADILNTDLENTKYKMVASSKIDNAIERIEKLLTIIVEDGSNGHDEYIDKSDVLEILINIGE